MLPAFFATLLFSVSVIAASRSTLLLGANVANFGRITTALVLLGLWAFTFGPGLGGGAFAWFFLSGIVGFGVGDLALFHAFPRLGPRLSSLMINCLAAPFGAAVEWLWLGTALSFRQVACGVLILTGVGLALAPDKRTPSRVQSMRNRLEGVALGVLAGFGQALGAVISRKAYAVSSLAGSSVDGGTAAFQRILGGFIVVVTALLCTDGKRLAKYQALAKRSENIIDQFPNKPLVPDTSLGIERDSRPVLGVPRGWAWVLLNAVAGPTLGVAFYQWALSTTPSGLVLAITSTTPLVVVPLAYWLDGDQPSAKSLVGGVVAVAGVVALALMK